jgi:glycosyltransferase involved in cell wall biosynthesis
LDTSKKHILLLSKWYPNLSDLQLGIFVQNQAVLMANKYTVTVIYAQPIQQATEKYTIKLTENNGVNEVNVYYKEWKIFKKIVHFFRYRKAQKLGLQAISGHVDLVHVHVPIRPAFLALRLHKRYAIPFIVTEHWSGHLNGQFTAKPMLYKLMYGRVLNKASKITAVSKALADKISGLSNKQVKVIPNYILASSNPMQKIATSNIQLISVSDLNDHTKNITGLIEGFKIALEENDCLHLTIIGDGPDKNKIIDKILALHLTEKVTLLGRKTQTEVLALLPSFDYYVCNSIVETFGMTVAEAILSGLPVICSRCGGPEEFVNENNGILFDVGNINQLKHAIIKMSHTFGSYNTIENQKNIEAHFGKKAILKQWEELYQSAILT